jgi:adenylosuccinate synthase
MNLEKLVKDMQVIAVVCNQWGDTGKGKFSDYFAEYWADVIARGTGGNNAGHTVVVNGEQRVFHLLPVGIVHDVRGKVNILGNGMVIDLKVLNEELNELDSEGISYNNLMISEDAHVIMPYHVSIDKINNQSQANGGIGSTGRGIGPAYEDKVGRRGVTVSDLLDRDTLAKKIRKNLERYIENSGEYLVLNNKVEEILFNIKPHIERIEPFIRDTDSAMDDFLRKGKRVLIEGAQGFLLSFEHGTYPYVTSSDCSLNGTANGIGISAKKVDLPLGIIKFPFMTRVGAGPFPTEIGGSTSENYCANPKINYETEMNMFGINENNMREKIRKLINSDDLMDKSIGMRLAAREYGATTRRPRRIGWTDAVAARYSVRINGGIFVLTKVDSISGMDEFRVCYEYIDENKKTTNFNKKEAFLRRIKPVFRNYNGYADIQDIRDYSKLPGSLRQSIEDFKSFTGGEVPIISVGPERDQTIIV